MSLKTPREKAEKFVQTVRALQKVTIRNETEFRIIEALRALAEFVDGSGLLSEATKEPANVPT